MQLIQDRCCQHDPHIPNGIKEVACWHGLASAWCTALQDTSMLRLECLHFLHTCRAQHAPCDMRWSPCRAVVAALCDICAMLLSPPPLPVNKPGYYYVRTDGTGHPSAVRCPEDTFCPGLAKQPGCVACGEGYTTHAGDPPYDGKAYRRSCGRCQRPHPVLVMLTASTASSHCNVLMVPTLCVCSAQCSALQLERARLAGVCVPQEPWPTWRKYLCCSC
jgi:hypothetical protein